MKCIAITCLSEDRTDDQLCLGISLVCSLYLSISTFVLRGSACMNETKRVLLCALILTSLLLLFFESLTIDK